MIQNSTSEYDFLITGYMVILEFHSRIMIKRAYMKSGPLIIMILMILTAGRSYSQEPAFTGYLDHPWVDSVLASLSMEERIAQSVFITTGAGRELSHYLLIDQLVREQGVGGLMISNDFASSYSVAATTAGVIRYFRSVSRVPLAVAMDGGRSDSSCSGGFWPGSPAMQDFPGPGTLVAAGDDMLSDQLGDILSRWYRQMGAQLVLTPASGIALPSVLEECFTVNHMVHLEKGPAGPDDTGLFWRFSKGAGLDGITVIDMDEEPDSARAKIASLLEWNTADTAEINREARMVLALKYWSGLEQEHQTDPVTEEDLSNTPETGALIRDIYANSLTVLNNQLDVIPLKGLDRLKIACISVTVQAPPGSGQGSLSPFQEMAANYTRMDQFWWHPGMTGEDALLEKLDGYDAVLAGIYPGNVSVDTGGIEDFISSLSKKTHVIAACFGEPALSEGVLSSDGLILAYSHNECTEQLAAQLIFGGIGGRGKLPEAIGDSYPAGTGINTPGGLRLQYAYPENAGISSALLNRKIDSVVSVGLEAGAFPGCEVIAARKGKVIFHRTYGYQTYDQRIDVRKQDLYDLASVTKVSGPLPGLMVLEGMGRFSYNDLLGKYVPAMRGSDKAGLWLKDILAHQAGLYPWIPFWQQTEKRNGSFKRRLVSSYPSDKFSMVVADHIYLKDQFRKKIYRTIRKSELGEKEYLYSGLAFFFFPEVIADLSGEPYEDFLYYHIYRRLGAWDLVYNPLRYYPLSRIAPTEYDSLFRKQQVRGYVHDESAATMGGFSGNAGLFATAGDLLKLIEMYRRMGSYGGEQIIPAEVMKTYTSYQFPENMNRRGLGFDKPLLGDRDGTPGDYPCPGASPSSFGHSGFTGTFVWADPDHKISYVFLSNRVYPTRNNNLISDMNIRTEVLQAIYDSILEDE